MHVRVAIRHADSILPGEPVEAGTDPRWQAIICVAEGIESDPEPIWEFARRWGSHPDEDLRDAIATCLLEHLLEHHFLAYFPRVEQAVGECPYFADTFQRCWQFGQSLEPDNATRFLSLQAAIGT